MWVQFRPFLLYLFHLCLLFVGLICFFAYVFIYLLFFKNYIMLLFCFIINFLLFFFPYSFLFLGLSVRACVQYRGKHMVRGIVFYKHHL